MSSASRLHTTELLRQATAGEDNAVEQFASVVYDELRQRARWLLNQERVGHSWDSADLVDEAYMKLLQQDRVDWRGRAHFVAVAVQAMRRLLVDHARAKRTVKRGGDRHRVDWSDDVTLDVENEEQLLAVDEALQELARLDEQHARLVELRFFGGMTMDQIATLWQVPKRTLEREWTLIRAWLRRELTDHQRE